MRKNATAPKHRKIDSSCVRIHEIFTETPIKINSIAAV